MNIEDHEIVVQMNFGHTKMANHVERGRIEA